MARQTQTEILNEVLTELQEIKKGLPNGELALMQKSLEDLEEGQKSLKSEIRTIQKRLFNPDSGLIVEVKKNTEFMKETQPKLKEVDAVVLICSLILLNPYLKPYHFIFFTPLLLLIKDSYLTNTKSMLLSIAYPSFFWIDASNLSVGTLTGYFQTVFFGLFVFNLVQLDLNRND